jgi:ArsR family transcriptional regulator
MRLRKEDPMPESQIRLQENKPERLTALLPSDLGPMSELLKTIGNEHRLRILDHLSAGEVSVSELQGKVGISQSLLSQNLAHLRRARLVAPRRLGKRVFYSLGSEAVAAFVRSLNRHLAAI